MEESESVTLKPIKNGWAACGDGWAVHGKTKEEAIALYHEAIERHKMMDYRASAPARVARFAAKLDNGDSTRPDEP